MSYTDYAMDIVNSANSGVQSAVSATQSYMSALDLQNGKSFSDIYEQNKANLMAENAAKDLFSQGVNGSKEFMSEFEESSINGLTGEELLEEFSKYAYGLREGTDGMNLLSPYTLSEQAKFAETEMRFNLDEVNALIEKMKKSGFNDAAVLGAMREAGKNVNGVSAEELQAIAAQTIFANERNMSLREQEDLLSFSRKFVSDNEEALELSRQIMTANASSALDSIANAIERNSEMTFSKNEIAALMQSLKVSDEKKAQVLQLFKNAENVKLDKSAFNTLFASIRQELADKQQSMSDFANAFAKESASVEAMLKERLSAELSAKNAGDKQSEITRMLMEHDLIENVVTNLRQGTLGSATSVEGVLAELSIQRSLNETNIKDTTSKLGPQTMADSLRGAMDLSRNSDSFRDSKDDRNSKKDTIASFTSFLGNIQQDKAGNVSQTKIDANAQSVFSQLENSILTATNKNINTLEVQLNPLDLGTLNIVLTMKNGQMSALIQPEKLETMQMINKQLDALKAELENQGVKLDNIEVELKSSGEESSMFAQADDMHSNGEESGSQQAYEELDSQLNDLQRLRVLGRDILAGTVDMESVSQEDYELAQNLLDSIPVGEEAEYFDNSSAINLVA